ncbi:hypothetical protein [Nonomuraea roseola]|uniref:Uncharacterized protein n=1 Tax=Nonomuraea roseola TaxID=46179 RepID=A0ABV5QAC7_9ACTN
MPPGARASRYVRLKAEVSLGDRPCVVSSPPGRAPDVQARVEKPRSSSACATTAVAASPLGRLRQAVTITRDRLL